MILRYVKLIRRAIVYVVVAATVFIPLGFPQASSPQQHAAMNAANASRHAEEEIAPLGPLSTAEKQGYGCIVAGGASLALTAISGTGVVVALFTGASVLPAADPFGFGLAVVGTVVASTCAVGALLAPAAIRLWRYYYDGAAIVQTP